MRSCREALELRLACLLGLIVLRVNAQSNCTSLCPDGSLVDPQFANVSAVTKQPGLGTLTCAEYQQRVMEGTFGTNQCNKAHYIGIKKCGCGNERDFCNLCENGAVPDLRRRIWFKSNCLGFAGEAYALDASDERCPAYQNTVGLYCGCNNTESVPGACRICDEPGGRVVRDPSKTIVATIGEQSGETECGELEYVGSRPDGQFSCEEVKIAGSNDCCSDLDFLDDVSCNFRNCLGALLDSFGEDFLDEKLNEYSQDAAMTTRNARNVMSSGGNVFFSTDRLRQAIKLVEAFNRRAKRISSNGGVVFGPKAGNEATTCAINLLDDLINNLSGTGVVSDTFLNGKFTKKLEKARALNAAREWKKSVKLANLAIRNILKETGERRLPGCFP